MADSRYFSIEKKFPIVDFISQIKATTKNFLYQALTKIYHKGEVLALLDQFYSTDIKDVSHLQAIEQKCKIILARLLERVTLSVDVEHKRCEDAKYLCSVIYFILGHCQLAARHFIEAQQSFSEGRLVANSYSLYFYNIAYTYTLLCDANREKYYRAKNDIQEICEESPTHIKNNLTCYDSILIKIKRHIADLDKLGNDKAETIHHSYTNWLRYKTLLSRDSNQQNKKAHETLVKILEGNILESPEIIYLSQSQKMFFYMSYICTRLDNFIAGKIEQQVLMEDIKNACQHVSYVELMDAIVTNLDGTMDAPAFIHCLNLIKEVFAAFEKQFVSHKSYLQYKIDNLRKKNENVINKRVMEYSAHDFFQQILMNTKPIITSIVQNIDDKNDQLTEIINKFFSLQVTEANYSVFEKECKKLAVICLNNDATYTDILKVNSSKLALLKYIIGTIKIIKAQSYLNDTDIKYVDLVIQQMDKKDVDYLLSEALYFSKHANLSQEFISLILVTRAYFRVNNDCIIAALSDLEAIPNKSLYADVYSKITNHIQLLCAGKPNYLIQDNTAITKFLSELEQAILTDQYNQAFAIKESIENAAIEINSSQQHQFDFWMTILFLKLKQADASLDTDYESYIESYLRFTFKYTNDVICTLFQFWNVICNIDLSENKTLIKYFLDYFDTAKKFESDIFNTAVKDYFIGESKLSNSAFITQIKSLAKNMLFSQLSMINYKGEIYYLLEKFYKADNNDKDVYEEIENQSKDISDRLLKNNSAKKEKYLLIGVLNFVVGLSQLSLNKPIAATFKFEEAKIVSWNKEMQFALSLALGYLCLYRTEARSDVAQWVRLYDNIKSLKANCQKEWQPLVNQINDNIYMLSRTNKNKEENINLMFTDWEKGHVRFHRNKSISTYSPANQAAPKFEETITNLIASPDFFYLSYEKKQVFFQDIFVQLIPDIAKEEEGLKYKKLILDLIMIYSLQVNFVELMYGVISKFVENGSSDSNLKKLKAAYIVLEELQKEDSCFFSSPMLFDMLNDKIIQTQIKLLKKPNVVPRDIFLPLAGEALRTVSYLTQNCGTTYKKQFADLIKKFTNISQGDILINENIIFNLASECNELIFIMLDKFPLKENIEQNKGILVSLYLILSMIEIAKLDLVYKKYIAAPEFFGKQEKPQYFISNISSFEAIAICDKNDLMQETRNLLYLNLAILFLNMQLIDKAHHALQQIKNINSEGYVGNLYFQLNLTVNVLMEQHPEKKNETNEKAQNILKQFIQLIQDNKFPAAFKLKIEFHNIQNVSEQQLYEFNFWMVILYVKFANANKQDNNISSVIHIYLHDCITYGHNHVLSYIRLFDVLSQHADAKNLIKIFTSSLNEFLKNEDAYIVKEKESHLFKAIVKDFENNINTVKKEVKKPKKKKTSKSSDATPEMTAGKKEQQQDKAPAVITSPSTTAIINDVQPSSKKEDKDNDPVIITPYVDVALLKKQSEFLTNFFSKNEISDLRKIKNEIKKLLSESTDNPFSNFKIFIKGSLIAKYYFLTVGKLQASKNLKLNDIDMFFYILPSTNSNENVRKEEDAKIITDIKLILTNQGFILDKANLDQGYINFKKVLINRKNLELSFIFKTNGQPIIETVIKEAEADLIPITRGRGFLDFTMDPPVIRLIQNASLEEIFKNGIFNIEFPKPITSTSNAYRFYKNITKYKVGHKTASLMQVPNLDILDTELYNHYLANLKIHKKIAYLELFDFIKHNVFSCPDAAKFIKIIFKALIADEIINQNLTIDDNNINTKLDELYTFSIQLAPLFCHEKDNFVVQIKYLVQAYIVGYAKDLITSNIVNVHDFYIQIMQKIYPEKKSIEIKSLAHPAFSLILECYQSHLLLTIEPFFSEQIAYLIDKYTVPKDRASIKDQLKQVTVIYMKNIIGPMISQNFSLKIEDTQLNELTASAISLYQQGKLSKTDAAFYEQLNQLIKDYLYPKNTWSPRMYQQITNQGLEKVTPMPTSSQYINN